MHSSSTTPTPIDPRDLKGPFSHRRPSRCGSRTPTPWATSTTRPTSPTARSPGSSTGPTLRASRSTTARPGAESLILAEARITYRAPTFYGETVTVETRATKVGRTSFHLEHRLTAASPGGASRLVAVSDSVLVRYDYATGRPVPLSSRTHRRDGGARGRDAHRRLTADGFDSAIDRVPASWLSPTEPTADAPNASSVFASNGVASG